MTRTARCLLSAAFVTVPAFVSSSARADDTIKHPGDHPQYRVELEPHGIFAWDPTYSAWRNVGLGPGFRASIALLDNGFIPKINNNVAITFGTDFAIHPCGGNCITAFFFHFPVALQWSFYVAKNWSVFGELGPDFIAGWYNGACGGRGFDCGNFTVRPAFFAGGRYHFNEKISLTMRLGYPMFTVGVSFFL
jgi:hypothetical protein